MYTPEMILEAGANAGIQRQQLIFLIQQLKIRYGSNVSQNSDKPIVSCVVELIVQEQHRINAAKTDNSISEQEWDKLTDRNNSALSLISELYATCR